jgi:serine/threonine protein kinase
MDDFPPFVEPNAIVTLPQAGAVVVLELLESGAFGQVFKVAHCSDRSQLFALKITPRQSDAIAAQTLNEIAAYAYAQSAFCEPALRAIGRMVDHRVARDYIFILLDLYDKSLLSLLTDEPDADSPSGLDLRRINRALRTLCPAFLEMERLGVRHTDVKPENIMLDFEGNCRLIDFGGARMQGVVIGTYVQTRWYRAPEVALGGTPTCAADIWSLGAVLAELFIGKPVCAGAPGVEYLRLLEVRLGPFPPALIFATAESARFFADGKVDGPEEPTDFGFLLDRPLRRLLMATSYDQDPEEAKELFIDLVMKMLKYDPNERITAQGICDHPFMEVEFPSQ